MPRRKYRIIEERMLADWLARNYRDHPRVMRAWLGPTPERAMISPFPADMMTSLAIAEPLDSRALARAGVTPRVLMPFGGGWADALILGPDWTRIVEACVVLDTAHVGQLEGYVELFKKTREYRPRWDLPIFGVLVYGYRRQVAYDLARRKGFELVQYRPKYVEDYYRELVGATP